METHFYSDYLLVNELKKKKQKSAIIAAQTYHILVKFFIFIYLIQNLYYCWSKDTLYKCVPRVRVLSKNFLIIARDK